ncbi:DUF87 domain-containing protein [Muricauda oceani]|uniref:ATP-binding protein n=1 Tax=Flagellimonas oceani TaxID=2698672 RepID=A0A6G7J145_9FLAO|nr:DUF87 domain-containing protein [Allomuricauda oceani]MBW8241419.1 DUF87 domain-containing protein [Allomuricauda oceani]QII44583.1 ATP-binding protein [Allomuricauda oceani]
MKLTQLQRVIVAILYLVVLFILFTIIDGNYNDLLWDTSNDKRIWFFSGALLIILGKYIAEPFFSKPTDAIANSLALLITLLTITDKSKFVFYEVVLAISFLVLFSSLLTIFLKNFEGEIVDKINRIAYKFSTVVGNSRVLFSFIYIPAIYSYFLNIDNPDVVAFVVLLAFWICIVFFDIIGKAVEFLGSLFKNEKLDVEELGTAISCENPLLYHVEIDYLKHKKSSVTLGDLVTIENEKLSKSIGIIINKKQLLNKLWLEIYLLTDEDNEPIKIPQNHRLAYDGLKSILKSLNSVSKINSLDSLPSTIKNKVTKSKLYLNRENFIGYIEKGSNINKIVFQHLGSNEINEGEIVTSTIYENETIYQLMDGLTGEEPLEFKDRYGYELAYARKLGFYDEDQHELKTRKWLPKIYEPVFGFSNGNISEEQLKNIAENSIGRLPGTNFHIPIKDYHSLVTHNTAILGILGIGKSRLTFELVKKLLDNIEDLKIVCIDITNEYMLDSKLPKYIDDALIKADDQNAFNSINATYNHIHIDGQKQIPEKSGNQSLYRKEVKKDLINFFFNQEELPENFEFNNDKRVRIYNPDLHKASKGEKIGFNVIATSMTQTEKTRIISEEILKVLMHYPPSENNTARVLIVFEEAHSLIPEWNSVANEGDKTAVNGTAKVLLQGRKYGLGSLIITQRTANISKSVLNQCNTIFALRVFDDTGKQFLENYIGTDYSNTLPTLEERQSIAVGKALKLKQPIIIQLNDMKYIMKNQEQEQQEE